jgi:hypothetical protein
MAPFDFEGTALIPWEHDEMMALGSAFNRTKIRFSTI